MVKYLQAETLTTAVAAESNIEMDVVVRQSVDSTSNWVLQQCQTGKDLPFACFAEEQTQGRGRRGKHWLMPAHSNIAMSVAWPFACSYQHLHLLPLTIAMAIVKTLEDLKLEHVQIKWPNDVYVRSKKIAGILIETKPVKSQSADKNTSNDRQIVVVIGVGLNYDMSSLRKDVMQDLPAFTDVCAELDSQAIKAESDRLNVASALLCHIINACQGFQCDAKHNLEKFRMHYDYCKGKSVEIILDDKRVLTGLAQGVNDNVELLVTIDGKECAFNSAEVSVKAEA